MKLTSFDPQRDFDTIKDWITDKRTHTMWCGRNFAFPLEKEDFIRGYAGFAERFGDVPYLAVSDEGEAQGFFSLCKEPETGEYLLKIVVVKPRCRGTGAAREMLRLAAERAFSDAGAPAVHLKVFLENVRAKRCYESVGFTERSTKHDALSYGEESWSLCDMVLPRPGGAAPVIYNET